MNRHTKNFFAQGGLPAVLKPNLGFLAVPGPGILAVSGSRRKIERFGDRLRRLLDQKDLTQSDLARRVFGRTKTDRRGYEVVVGKDLISDYVNNKSIPRPTTLKRIAGVLGVKPEQLAPEYVEQPETGEAPATLEIVAVQGHTDQVAIRINRVLPLEMAVRIAGILAELDEKKH